MARKLHNKDKEWTESQKLKDENRRLRRQIGKLRRVISRLDIERYQYLKELLESQENQDAEAVRQVRQKDVEQKWECYECGEGILRIIVFNRANDTVYLRKCDNCGKRTKMKKFNEEVKGA